jgi:small GTP-binding protein
MSALSTVKTMYGARTADHIFKAILIGDSGVGKTSLMSRFARSEFSHHFTTTVGVDLVTRVLETERGEKVALQIWDTAGQVTTLNLNCPV